MCKEQKTGRVTIPTDVDVVPETLELLKRWGADAIRDCDGTDYPEELRQVDAKVYSTYYTTRKDNAWAKANPDEVQQCYIMTGFHTALDGPLSIPLMKGISPDLLKANDHDDIRRWWEVMDRTIGDPVSADSWRYEKETGCVVIDAPQAFHDYTVSFLAYLIWDPVHMYNAVTNDWKDFERQITFDVRQPKTRKYTMERLRKFIEEHPYVNVIRYTTFFHQFTLVGRNMWTGTVIPRLSPPTFWSSLNGRPDILSVRSILSTRGITITSTGSRLRNIKILWPSSAGKWQSW